MPDPWEPALASVRSDSILKKQMSTVHADLDAIAVKCDDPVSWDKQFNGGIVGMRELRYGLGSCQLEHSSDGGQGLSAATNSRQALSCISHFISMRCLTADFLVLGFL